AVSTARANMGLVFAKRGDWAKAEEQLLGSVEIINRLDNPYSLATRYEELARLYDAQGRGGDAASWRTRAEGLFARLQGIEPAAAMTVTIVPNQADFLSGDLAIATAQVYRTPGPANYTYNWTVRDILGRVLNTTIYGASKFAYTIPLNYTGRLTFFARVDDGQGLTSNAQRTVSVFVAVMSLRLDRGDFTPGDAITASYSVTSHVILRPSYDYQVADSSLTIVLSGNTNNTTFSFRTPAPAASRTYRFLVT